MLRLLTAQRLSWLRPSVGAASALLGCLGGQGRKNEGGYHLPFTIYRLPLITIDLTAHPRCFLTVTASGVFAPPRIGFVTYSITSAPSIALLFSVPSLTTGSAILRALLCQRHSPRLTAYTMPLYLVYRHRLHSRHPYQLDLCLWSR